MNKFIVIAGILVTLILIAGCTQQIIPPVQTAGFLEGKISIGPLCPVARNPPDPACEPTAETYNSWPINVWSEDKTLITQLSPALDGTYKETLLAGTYIVDLQTASARITGGSNLPQTVKITAKETTQLNIDIDTGIR